MVKALHLQSHAAITQRDRDVRRSLFYLRLYRRATRKKQVHDEIFLDSFMDISYIQAMIVMNLLTLKVARKAAWQPIAVAEGGFY